MSQERTMTNAHSTDQTSDCVRVKNIAYHAIRFGLKEATFWPTGNHTSCILATMLEKRETFTYLWRSMLKRIVKEKTKYSTH
jgi:hypothetical protein